MKNQGFHTDPTLPATPAGGQVGNAPPTFPPIEAAPPANAGAAARERVEFIAECTDSIVSSPDFPDADCEASLDPYQGCEHGCVYCYSRRHHDRAGLSAGLDFETRILHKPMAARLLAAELAAPAYRCRPLALGTTGDAYQPGERKLGLTRTLLEVLVDARHPVSVVTKSPLILRDLDLWSELAAQGLARVAISLSSLNHELARQLEPRAAAPRARLETMERLAAAGIPVGILVAPLIPALNDDEIESLLAAGQQGGAAWASHAALRLPAEVAGFFRNWLRRHAPAPASRIITVLYDIDGRCLSAPGLATATPGFKRYAALVTQRFELACRQSGVASSPPPLDCGLFRRPFGGVPADRAGAAPPQGNCVR